LSAAHALVGQPPCASATEAKRNVNLCVKAVAALLGNTAAVCRDAYIHPLVLEAYQRGALPFRAGRSPRAFELSVIRFLEAARESAG
jgi:DNA topoisomerase-1